MARKAKVVWIVSFRNPQVTSRPRVECIQRSMTDAYKELRARAAPFFPNGVVPPEIVENINKDAPVLVTPGGFQFFLDTASM